MPSAMLTPTLVRKLSQAGASMQKKDESSVVQECIEYIKSHKDQIHDIHYVLHQGLVPLIMQ